MEPTLLIGDRIFVTKYNYGFSKHSFPFSPNLSNKRLFNKIKAGSKGGRPGQWSARKAQMLAKQYKAAGGGYK